MQPEKLSILLAYPNTSDKTANALKKTFDVLANTVLKTNLASAQNVLGQTKFNLVLIVNWNHYGAKFVREVRDSSSEEAFIFVLTDKIGEHGGELEKLFRKKLIIGYAKTEQNKNTTHIANLIMRETGVMP